METINPSSTNDSKINEWFGALIHQLRTHELQLETGTASKDIADFYEKIINGEEIKLFAETRQGSTKFFVKKIVEAYLKELVSRKIVVKKLALSTSDERILVWLQINDDDFASEKGAILSQSKVNSSFHEYGFHIESMIVEDCDRLEVPAHYHVLFD